MGQTLTATAGDIADVDGLPDPFLTDTDTSFQWIRVATDNTETDISGATASTYTLLAGDLGKKIKVKVTFTDDGNTAETLTSAATATVVAAHCNTSNTNELWCATLTVGTINDGGFIYTGYASGSGAYGGLAPSTFTYRTVTIGVDVFEYDANGLYFEFERSAGTTPPDGLLGAGAYTLEIGTGGDKKSFLQSNPGTSRSLVFADHGLSWSSGDTVPVKLVRAPNTAPTSADSTVTATEDTDYSFSASDFPFMDTDVGAEFVLVKILTLPASGTLTLSNITLTPTALPQPLAPAPLDDDRVGNDLIYIPPANANGDDLTSFTFSVYDGAVDSATHTLTIDVTAVNDAATGKPGITGTAQVGQTLTATAGNIADLDGLPDPFLTDTDTSFQWIQVATDNTETDISGATASTYTLLAGELGKTIKVKVTFTDDGNTAETLTSAATAVVAAGTDTTPPTVMSIVRQDPASTPTNADTLIWRVTFSEPVSNVDTADFTVSGTTATVTAVSAAAGVANAYDVTASGGNLASRNDTVTLSFAVGQNITDAASNALTDTAPSGTNHNSYVLDNTAPTVTITGVPNPSSAAFTATFTFLEPVTGFAVGDITLGNATAANFAVTSTTVYTALITPTAEAAFTVDVAANVATDTAGNGNTAAVQVSSTYSIGICPRTQQVRDAILGKISGVTNCALVTDLHLAAVSGTLDLFGGGITTLQSGDFDGLTALTYLELSSNLLTALPAGVFDDLSALTTLELDYNSLAALPAGVFADLSALTTLELNSNSLAALPAGVFDGLSALTRL